MDINPILTAPIGAVLLLLMYFMIHRGFHSHCVVPNRVDLELDVPTQEEGYYHSILPHNTDDTELHNPRPTS